MYSIIIVAVVGGGGGGIKEYLGPKNQTFEGNLSQNGGEYFWLFLSNEPIESITENNGCAMFEGKSV